MHYGWKKRHLSQRIPNNHCLSLCAHLWALGGVFFALLASCLLWPGIAQTLAFETFQNSQSSSYIKGSCPLRDKFTLVSHHSLSGTQPSCSMSFRMIDNGKTPVWRKLHRILKDVVWFHALVKVIIIAWDWYISLKLGYLVSFIITYYIVFATLLFVFL